MTPFQFAYPDKLTPKGISIRVQYSKNKNRVAGYVKPGSEINSVRFKPVVDWLPIINCDYRDLLPEVNRHFALHLMKEEDK